MMSKIEVNLRMLVLTAKIQQKQLYGVIRKCLK